MVPLFSSSKIGNPFAISFSTRFDTRDINPTMGGGKKRQMETGTKRNRRAGICSVENTPNLPLNQAKRRSKSDGLTKLSLSLRERAGVRVSPINSRIEPVNLGAPRVSVVARASCPCGSHGPEGPCHYWRFHGEVDRGSADSQGFYRVDGRPVSSVAFALWFLPQGTRICLSVVPSSLKSKIYQTNPICHLELSYNHNGLFPIRTKPSRKTNPSCRAEGLAKADLVHPEIRDLATFEVPTYSNPCGGIPTNEKWNRVRLSLIRAQSGRAQSCLVVGQIKI
jgi:hypothetical protein